jgi:hypothetical protein
VGHRVQHHLTESPDLAGVLDDVGELVGPQEPTIRMIPAGQGLKSDPRSRLQTDDWLLVRHGFALVEGGREPLGEFATSGEGTVPS